MQPTVLVVEDDRDLLETVSKALSEGGFAVKVARDGLGAMALARVIKPAVILLDLAMPTMSGFEFRDRQSRDPALADVPVVVMTGMALQGAGQINAEAVLVKPFGLDLLVATVVACLATSSAPTALERFLSFVG